MPLIKFIPLFPHVIPVPLCHPERSEGFYRLGPNIALPTLTIVAP